MFDFTPFFKENFPKVREFARTFGLQNADCEDVSQDVMKSVWEKVQSGRADPLDPGINGYIFQLARWRITDKTRSNFCRNKEISQVGDENNLDELPAPKVDETWKTELLVKATKSIKSSVSKNYYKYFIAQFFGGKDADEMLKVYGIKKSHAYLAKHRVGHKVIAAAKEIIKANGI